jgi:flagellar biosynthesis/type III secretory pathway protein FliH
MDREAHASPRAEASEGGAWPPADLPDLEETERKKGHSAEELEEAYERGCAEGAALGRERVRETVAALRQVTDNLSASKARILQNLEENVFALTLAVAKKILLRELAADPSVVKELIAGALKLVGPESPVEVRLHPEDLEVLREELEQTASAESLEEIRWVGDESLERGSFLAEGPHRIVDGRVDEALRSLYERLTYE